MEGWEAPESQRGCARRLPGRRPRPGRMLPQYSTRRRYGGASWRPAFRASAAGSGARCYPRVPDDAPPNARIASCRVGSVGWVRCRWRWRLGLEPLLGRPACAHAVAPALQRPLLQVAVAASLAAGRAGSASQNASMPAGGLSGARGRCPRTLSTRSQRGSSGNSSPSESSARDRRWRELSHEILARALLHRRLAAGHGRELTQALPRNDAGVGARRRRRWRELPRSSAS